MLQHSIEDNIYTLIDTETNKVVLKIQLDSIVNDSILVETPEWCFQGNYRYLLRDL